jgi:hypothetical protein
MRRKAIAGLFAFPLLSSPPKANSKRKSRSEWKAKIIDACFCLHDSRKLHEIARKPVLECQKLQKFAGHLGVLKFPTKIGRNQV